MALVEARQPTKVFRRPDKPPGPAGSVRHLFSRRYVEKVAVDGVDLSIEAGEAVAYVGPNGAGKSTTVKLLSGIGELTSGEVRIDGLVPQRERMAVAHRIGVLFGQRTQLWWDLPVADSLAVLRDLYGVDKATYEKRLSNAINEGSLDYLLVRPYPVVLQVTSAEVGINDLTNMVTGGAMLGVALARVDVEWSALTVLPAAVLLLGAVFIKVAINLAMNSISFWLNAPSPMFAMAVHQVGELARFPLSVYPLALKATLGFVVPFAFVSTFPISSLMNAGSTPWLGLLTPVVAVYCVAVALVVFARGLRRYESAGN